MHGSMERLVMRSQLFSPSAPELREGSVVVVLGTRPELIKMAGILRSLGAGALIVHTGQHFSDDLSAYFFGEFGLAEPFVNLGIGGTSRGEQIGRSTMQINQLLDDLTPSVVVVQGDTNSTVAGALAANAREVPLVHVEAGLRSFDRRMPEEHNRVVTDHLSDLLFAPTQLAEQNLLQENISASTIEVVGNTIVEAVLDLLPASDFRSDLRDRIGQLDEGAYVIATFHRPENVDNRQNLELILDSLRSISVPVVLPLHPRTRARVKEFGLEHLLRHIVVTEPLNYRSFLALAADCALIVSDSGGVQEESSVLKRPVVVVRRSTERPEVLGTFARLVPPNEALGPAIEAALAELPGLQEGLADLPSPYGEGHASGTIVQRICDLFV